MELNLRLHRRRIPTRLYAEKNMPNRALQKCKAFLVVFFYPS